MRLTEVRSLTNGLSGVPPTWLWSRHVVNSAVVADLIQVLAVERGARVRADINRARGFPTRWVERPQIIAGCNPDLFAIKGDPVHAIDTRKGSVLTNNLCR